MPRKRRTFRQWFGDQGPVMRTLAVVGAVAGVVVAVPGAVLVLAAPIHSYVDGRIEFRVGPLQIAFTDTSSAVRDLQIEAAEGKHSAVGDAIVKWEVELKKTEDGQTRELIRAQVRELEATHGKLEEQLDVLRDIRRKRREQ